MKKVAIIGRTEAMLNTGKLLIEKGYVVPLVITSKEAPEYNLTAKDFENFASEIGALFINTAKVNTPEIIELIKSLGPIDIACSINFSGIISKQIIDLFEHGILNSHAGDLPKYKGNAVAAWAIINNEDRIGLCIHRMVGGELDSGEIVSRIYKEITCDTKVKELLDWTFDETPNLFLESVEKLKRDPDYVLQKRSTDKSKELRCYPRLPEDGLINWKDPSEDIIRLINASGDPFKGAYTYLDNQEVIILDASVYNDEEIFVGIPGQVASKLKDGSITILTGTGKIKINKIKIEPGNDIIVPQNMIKSLRKRFRNNPV